MPVVKRSIDKTGKTWTYGAEHELVDWDTRKGWDGFERDPEPNIVNSNGIAGDPTLRDYPFGAEINTRPSASIHDQVDQFIRFCRKFPRAKPGIRSGLHIHIRIPGLKDSLSNLQVVQEYVQSNREIFQSIDPIPYSNNGYCGPELNSYRKWVQCLRRSHWTVIPSYRVQRQRSATNLDEFLRLEVPMSKGGKPLYHAQPRATVNLRQLLQTDTVEFRSFFQPLDPLQVQTAIEWCRDFLLACFDDYPAVRLYQDRYRNREFPPMPKYEHWKHERWKATSFSLNRRDQVRYNIRRIVEGSFDNITTRFPYLEV